MNKLFSHVVILFAAALSLTSCLSDNDESETTYYTDTAISSFSLGTLNITYHTTASDGVTDSTYKSTFSASSYAFDIDQQKGTIANEDSLPVGTDAAHCLATINTVNSGTVLLVLTSSTGADSLAYYSSSDSIDFTSPVRLRVYNMEGSAYRNYIVTVNVHKQKENQFSWQEDLRHQQSCATRRRRHRQDEQIPLRHHRLQAHALTHRRRHMDGGKT